MSKLKRAVRKFSRDKQTVLKSFPATMGDGKGNVETDRTGYVYVRWGNKVRVVYNDSIAPQHNLPIIVGYTSDRPDMLRVLSVRSMASVGYTGKQALNKPVRHHKTHEFGDEENSDDIVWVQLRQFMPLRLTVAEDMKVAVTRGVVTDYSGAWAYTENDLIDLNGLQPDNSGTYRWMLFSFDQTRELIITTGSMCSGTVSLNTIPDYPDDTSMGIGAVRLYGNQYKINETKRTTDIVDLRFPYHHDHQVVAAGVVVNTTRVTTTYTVLTTDHTVFCDTDGGAFTITLPAGVEGQTYKIINCGSGGNNLTIDGNGAETIFSEATQYLADAEVLDLTFNTTEGWW